jgi:hypothetical protein
VDRRIAELRVSSATLHLARGDASRLLRQAAHLAHHAVSSMLLRLRDKGALGLTFLA